MLGSFVLHRTFGILWLTFFTIVVVVVDIIFRLHVFHSTQCVLAYRNLCLQANLYSFVFSLIDSSLTPGSTQLFASK